MFEIPVNERKFEELMEFFTNKRSFVFFQAEDKERGVLEKDTVFLIAHGTPEGSIIFNENAFSVNEDLLTFFIKKLKLEERGVKKVVYNACHGGVNKNVHVGEYSLMCMHQDIGTTSIRVDRDVWHDPDSQGRVTVFCKTVNPSL